MNSLTFDLNNFYLDGKPFRMIVGDIHYFRIHPNDWEKRLDLAVDFGLNTVQTYVPWNAHEPKRGEFCFEGILDLGAFLRLCREKGLKVLLRPSPYICSEWDFGGLPSRLLKNRELVIRSSDSAYLDEVEKYYNRLIPEFLTHLATNGGPIIAVALENEYGSYGNDHEYLDALAKMLRDGGVDVPFYTTDGDGEYFLTFGRQSKNDFFGVNYRAKAGTSQHAEQIARKFGKEMPYFVGEFWAGRSMHWGEPFSHRPPEETSDGFREALELGGHVSFYMFSGGTNFGFMGGANYGRSYTHRPNSIAKYIPHTTSYDADALVSESGQPTKKYFLCRDVLDEYLGKEKRPHKIPEYLAQNISVKFTQTADFFDNIDVLTETKAHSLIPKPMEDYDQNYGMILYTTQIEAFEEEAKPLCPYRFKDRANIYVDGEWFATYMRDRGVRAADREAVVNGMATIVQNGTERRVDVLVENMGRVNYGKEMSEERKGMEDCILYNGAKLMGYDTRTIPLENITRICWKNAVHYSNHKPCFFKGTFDAKSGIDTYACFETLSHGYMWINGFNLGRYDSAGPQMTLYIPGYLLKEKDNELVIFDVDPIGKRGRIDLIDHEILDCDSSELS